MSFISYVYVRGKFQRMSVTRMPRPHHAVSTQQKRRDLADRWRVAVVIAGQVSTPTASMGDTVLPVVTGTEDPVQTEEQQHQQDTCSQAQSCHPEERGDR